MTKTDLIAKLSEIMESSSNYETNDIYEKGYYAGVTETINSLLDDLKELN